MCEEISQDQHKHPATPTAKKQFIQHKQEYVAWALRLLDRQRQALRRHSKRLRISVRDDDFGGYRGAVVHRPAPAAAGFTPRPIKRYFG